MPSSLSNVKLGVCSLTFNAVDLGYTKGGVDVEVSTETYTVMVDQFGNTPINDYIIGRTCTVTTPLAETTLDNLVSIMPGATKVTDAVDNTKIKVDVVNGVGTNLIDSAQELVLHPIAAGASVAEDFVIPKANTPGQMTFAYRLDEERIFNCTWTAYPDTSASNLLFTYGDKTATA